MFFKTSYFFLCGYNFIFQYPYRDLSASFDIHYLISDYSQNFVNEYPVFILMSIFVDISCGLSFRISISQVLDVHNLLFKSKHGCRKKNGYPNFDSVFADLKIILLMSKNI